MFRFSGVVAVVPASVWPSEERELLAVDRPIAVTGESDVSAFRSRCTCGRNLAKATGR